MASAVNTGSINMPKMLRHLSHRTNQVRDLVFIRDPIKRKDIKTTGQTSATKGTSTALAGPAVNFGYETNSSAAQSASADTAYHVSSPELILPGLKAIQSLITSRSGQHERSGHRITGACKFYLPSLDHIRSLDNFGETPSFDEIETFDKLIDMERIIFSAFDKENIYGDSLTSGGWQNDGYNVGGGMDTGKDGLNATSTSTQTQVTRKSNSENPRDVPGYEMDRIQFQVKSTGTIDHVTIDGLVGNATVALKWDGNLPLSVSEWTTIDLPLRNISVGDTTTVYRDGTAYTFTASAGDESSIFDFDKAIGDSTNRVETIYIRFTSSVAHEVRFLKIYKAAEWRVESIKDYRDEYMEIGAVRVRGDRTSRRRSYG